MKKLFFFLALANSVESFAQNKIWSAEMLFAQPDSLIACSEVTANKKNRIAVTVYKERSKVIGAIFQNDKNIVEASLKSSNSTSPMGIESKVYFGRGFDLSLSLEIKNPISPRGNLYKVYSTDGNLDYVDNSGKKQHAVVACSVKYEAL